MWKSVHIFLINFTCVVLGNLKLSMRTDTCVLMMSLNFHAVSSIPSYQIYKEDLPILKVMVSSFDEVVVWLSG